METVRIYADIGSETNAKLEELAKANGRTKKGQIEFLIREAIAERNALEAETEKRAKAEKKGKR